MKEGWICTTYVEINKLEAYMAIKTYQLMKLEELGVVYQNHETHEWYIGMHGDTKITDQLFAAGMFEH